MTKNQRDCFSLELSITAELQDINDVDMQCTTAADGSAMEERRPRSLGKVKAARLL